MCKMIDQYADKIKGQFSFFDRMIINGYFRPLMAEQSRIGCLFSMGIPLREFTDYFKNVTEQLISNIENSAAELGRPIVYLSSAKDRKEDIAKILGIRDTFSFNSMFLISLYQTRFSCIVRTIYSSHFENIEAIFSAYICSKFFVFQICIHRKYNFIINTKQFLARISIIIS